MKIAVISDIHSNFFALETAYQEILSCNVDEIYCLGDIIGYGPQPRECVDFIIQHKIRSVLGNHDYALLHPEILKHFTVPGRKGILFSFEQLRNIELNFFKKNSLLISKPFAHFVHSSISFPTSWFYLIDDIILIQENFDMLNPGIPLFIGHTHKQIAFVEKEPYQIEVVRESQIFLHKHKKYIINVGSIGQPRDEDPRLAFVVYDTQARKVDFVRQQYPIEKTARKIYSISVLPNYLGDRLFRGN